MLRAWAPSDLFGLDRLVADKAAAADDESAERAEGEMKRKRDQTPSHAHRLQTNQRAVKRRKELMHQQTDRLPPLRAPPYTVLVARDLSCAQAVKPTYMSKEWAADENQSLWDPYSYVAQDRRERRRRLGVAIPLREIKDIEELRHIFIPSVHKDDQLIRCIATGNETVRSLSLSSFVWLRDLTSLTRLLLDPDRRRSTCWQRARIPIPYAALAPTRRCRR
jgi:hypothetical protein